MSVRKLAVMTMLAGAGIAVLALVAALGAPSAFGQIRPYTPPKAAGAGADWTERIEEILPPGVESRAEGDQANSDLHARPREVPGPSHAVGWEAGFFRCLLA